MASKRTVNVFAENLGLSDEVDSLSLLHPGATPGTDLEDMVARAVVSARNDQTNPDWFPHDSGADNYDSW